MAIWTSLFGAKDIVDRVGDMADEAFHTKEEKARHYIEVLKHIEPFKVAQRWLACIVVIPFVLVWIMCALCFLVSGFFDGDKAGQLMELSNALAEKNSDNLGLATALILSFYFAGGMTEGIISKWKAR